MNNVKHIFYIMYHNFMHYDMNYIFVHFIYTIYLQYKNTHESHSIKFQYETVVFLV